MSDILSRLRAIPGLAIVTDADDMAPHLVDWRRRHSGAALALVPVSYTHLDVYKRQMQLKDRVAIITGASQGIGEGIAREYIAEGAKVILADIQDDKGQALAAELGGNCRFVHCDVSQSADATAVVEAALAAFGRLDIVVCNSGINLTGTILDLSEADFDKVLSVNLKGAFLVGQAGARWMAAHGVQGSIINMSSINAIVASPHILAYAVSKGGINQLTSAMALGLAPHGIRVNGVGPGSIATELLDKIFENDPAVQKLSLIHI